MGKTSSEIGAARPVAEEKRKRLRLNPAAGELGSTAAKHGQTVRTVVEIRSSDGKVLKSVPFDRPGRSEPAIGRVAAVMQGAADQGLTLTKNGRIAGRVSAELIAAAKSRTGLQSDTELVEFALANVALDDNFATVFREVKGTIDPDLDLGF